MVLAKIILSRATKSLGSSKKGDIRAPDGRAVSSPKSDKHHSTAGEVQAWLESNELRPPQ